MFPGERHESDGNALIVNELPNSADGILLRGDRIEVNGELKILRQDLISDSGGNGIVYFDPPLRDAPADNTPIIVRNPGAMFMIAGFDSGFQTRAGNYSDFLIQAVESIV